MDNEVNIKIEDKINLLKIFLVFFKIGLTGFGPAMLMEVKKNIVKKLKWINEKELLEGLALAQLIPAQPSFLLQFILDINLKGY